MENYFLKIIQLFGYSSSHILIISIDTCNFKSHMNKWPKKLISHICLKQNDALELLRNHPQKRIYDLIILDRIWNKNDETPKKIRTFLNQIFFRELIKNSLSPNGQIICLAENKLNLHAPFTCIKSIFNALLRRNIPPFTRYYSKWIRAAGCAHIKRFHLIPDLRNFNYLISDNRKTTLEFMRKSRGFTNTLPRNPKDWPKWLLVWFSIDKCFVSTHLFWGRK